MIRVRRTIAAPANVVWDLLEDTTSWPAWGPAVAGVDYPARLLQDRARGRIRVRLGLWLPFEVTRFEPGHSFHWNVAGVPGTGHRVRAISANRCELSFEVPVWAAPYALVCKFACERIATLVDEWERRDACFS